MGFFVLLGIFYFLIMPILLFVLWGRIRELERRMEHNEVPTAPTRAATSTPSPAFAEKKVAQETPKPVEPETSLEDHLTKNWFQWLGISALLIGLIFFLKWAFDSGMIGSGTLTLFGYVLCAAAIGAGMWLQKIYGPWGLTFSGGGILGSYVVTWLALHQFMIFDPSVAFFFYIVGAACACLLAARYNNQPIAAFGIVGGFLTPILVDVHAITALILMYILFLDLAIFALAVVRSWRWISVCGLIGTVLYELSARWNTTAEFAPLHGLIFVGAFTVIYLLVAMFYSVIRREQTEGEQGFLMVGNAAAHFVLALSWMNVLSSTSAARAMTALVFGALLGVLAIGIFLRNAKDSIGVVTSLALMVFFVGISVPLQFGGVWVPFAWTLLATFLVYTSVAYKDARIQPIAWTVLGASFLWYFFPGLSCIFSPWISASCESTALFRTDSGFFLFGLWVPLLVILAAMGIGAKDECRYFGRVALVALACLCLGIFAQWPESTQVVYLSRAQRLVQVLGILVGGAIIHAIGRARRAQLTEEDTNMFAGLLVSLHVVGLWYLTQEYILAIHDGLLPFLGTSAQVEHVGVSVLWALFGAVSLANGLMIGHKALRYFSIALLLITTSKLALFDFVTLGTGARIVGFTFLGVILVVASLFYQRRK